jgi:PKD repeat protein
MRRASVFLASLSVALVFDASPAAANSVGFTPSCSGLSCSFSAYALINGDNAMESLDWDFGDGTRGSGANVEHTYAEPGTYTVTLTATVYNLSGEYYFLLTASQDLAVVLEPAPPPPPPPSPPPPNATPRAAFTMSCSGLACSFDGSGSTDSDGTIVASAWSFGDGTTGSGATVQHVYAQSGIYTVTLRVTDDLGAVGTTSTTVAVEAPNAAPAVVFTRSCSGLGCGFDGRSSSDSDGAIVSYSWSFGDGTTGSGASTQHTYAQPGTYTVTLTVTDDDGVFASDSKVVAVITLTATGYKVKGVQEVALAWAGSGAAGFVVYRNGVTIATVDATTYTDNLNTKGPGSYAYYVCATATAICSNATTVSF